ncbi:hypothetical protein FCV25MIE_17750 [Fagus crenata]
MKERSGRGRASGRGGVLRSGQGRASGRGGVLRSGRGEAEIWLRRCAQIWSRRRKSETVCSELVEAASLDIVEAAMCQNGRRGCYGLRTGAPFSQSGIMFAAWSSISGGASLLLDLHLRRA